ncbi:Protein of unknown function [Gryllus bimaculatus]|nr:Protein of unknown function [Gryllus bimaculatus]
MRHRHEQVLRSGCRKPSDPALEGRVMLLHTNNSSTPELFVISLNEYSLCYLVNFHQGGDERSKKGRGISSLANHAPHCY